MVLGEIFNSLSKDQDAIGVFRLDKAIDNEKLDLELAIGKIKKAKG